MTRVTQETKRETENGYACQNNETRLFRGSLLVKIRVSKEPSSMAAFPGHLYSISKLKMATILNRNVIMTGKRNDLILGCLSVCLK